MWHRSVNYVVGAIVKRCNCSSMVLWYYAPYSATARRPGVEMMSVTLLQPVAISTERSTDGPCALDMCNTARSFSHKSNTWVIRRLPFPDLGFVNLLSCTAPCHPPQPRWQNSSLSTNPKTLGFLWVRLGDCSERSWAFPKWECWRSALGNLGCSKKITEE